MKYTVRQYAEALNSALKGKEAAERKKAVGRFLNILRKHRDSARLGRILKEAELLHLKESGLRKVRVEAASPVTEGIKSEIKEILGDKVYLEEEVNPELLAGLRILVDEEIFIDASAKRRLGEMLRST